MKNRFTIKVRRFWYPLLVFLTLTGFHENAISQTESKTDLHFVYKPGEVDLSSMITATASSKITASTAGPQINKKTDRFNIGSTESLQFRVNGTVTDQNGTAIPGATILEKGTTNGVISDIDGRFSIEVSDENGIIVLSFVGYATKEVPVNGQSSLDITLEESSVGLDEVVVTAYGTQKKQNLTGAIGVVRAEELDAASNVASATNALAGRVAGLVSLQSTGVPGYDNSSLSIRGFGNALVIVDGIEADFNSIDVDQIESISVLKDGSASMFGSRAGNGVILITTKRGTVGKPVIKVNSAYNVQGVTNQPTGVTSWQFAELERERHLNSGNTEDTAPFTREQVEKYRLGNDPNFPNTNWYDYLVRDWAPMWQNDLSIRGGSEKVKYYGFIGFLDQQTMFKFNGGGYNRFNLQSNIDAEILDNLSFQLDLYSVAETRRQTASGYGPNGGAFTAIWQSQPVFPSSFPDPTKLPSNRRGGGGQGHVMTNMDLIGYNRNNAQNFRGSAALNYKFNFIPGLTARAFINANQYYTTNKNFVKPYQAWYYDYDGDIYTSAGPAGSARLALNKNQSTIITQQYSLNYDRTFSDDHHVTFLGLYEAIEYQDDFVEGRRSNFLTPAIEQMFGGDPATMESYGSEGEMGRKSGVFRLNYSFRNKYLLETSLRADASAKFSEDNRWGYFPSISAGWVVSEESFMKNFSQLDFLKFRASYGRSGNDGVGNFQYLSGFALSSFPAGGSYLYGPSNALPTLEPTGLANPNLTWEEFSIYNSGVDFSFWNERLYGTGEVFYRTRTGIPATRLTSLPSTFGSNLPPENLNSSNNRGFELSLGSKSNVGELAFDISGNISWSRSQWNHFEEPDYDDPDQERLFRISGNWADRTIGYRTDGIFTSQEEIESLPFDQDTRGNASLRPGDIRFVDTNEDGVLDWRDQVEIGLGNRPNWMAGLNLSLKYKRFDFSALFQGAFGFYTLLPSRITETYTDQYYSQRWTEENNNPNALFPRNGGSLMNGYVSDFWFRKADYLRLKNMNIGYNLPIDLLSRLKITQCRIYVAGHNLLTFSGLNEYHIDPEAPSNVGMYYYPQQRTFTLGGNISF